MAEIDNMIPEEDTLIYEADTSLRRKLGSALLSLEAILTPEVVNEAQTVMTSMEKQLLQDMLQDVAQLTAEVKQLEAGQLAAAHISTIAAMGFKIKSRAGLCDYALASALARSLHLFCESIDPVTPLAQREVEIISCLTLSLKTVFDLCVTGMGGKTGAAITAELKRLAIRFQ